MNITKIKINECKIRVNLSDQQDQYFRKFVILIILQCV